MKKTPFHEIVDLFTDNPTTVTLSLLDKVKGIMKPYKDIKRYSEAYEILEYLGKNNALNIKTTESGSHIIHNPYYVKSEC